MSKSPSKPAKDAKDGNEVKVFPTCSGKKQARMVCLNDTCETHPFFCSLCEDEACEKPHQHQNKITSIGYKQFARKVLKDRKPTEKLGNAIGGYREVLERLKKDVSQFVEKQTLQLDQIVKKAAEVVPEDAPIIAKLKASQFQGLTGKQMDQLWGHSTESEEKLQAEEEMSQFIKIKEEEVKGISEHFEHLNRMQLDKIEEEPSENKANIKPPPAAKK